NTLHNKFSSSPLKTNSIILEYYKPSWVKEKEFLNIQSIGILTKNFSLLLKGFGDSQSCMINAKCPDYNNWCNQRRSVALIIRVLQDSREIRWCSGSLVTNEKRDGTPFFLTAFHCLDINENNVIEQTEKDDIQNWVFVFNYQSNNCANPSSEPSLSHSISGAYHIISHTVSDYALLQLNQKPPASYNTYYSGWTNDAAEMTNTGVCIHHPKADIKKISTYKKEATMAYFWKVKYTAGSTQGGSSGSPLFNSMGRIVGQLRGGHASCLNPNETDEFGRFDRSWSLGLCWKLNPNGIHTGPLKHYTIRMDGDETCKDNWDFKDVSDLHTSTNVSFVTPATVGTRQYDGVYNAKYSIVAENVTIKSGTSVTFEAGSEILLKSVFNAELGSIISLKIGDCLKGCDNGF
ncbi:MAG: 3-coathanger stack domain-containing protein, partial [Bacteroidales bacterium]